MKAILFAITLALLCVHTVRADGVADTLVDFNNVYCLTDGVNLAASPNAVLTVQSFDPTPWLPPDASRDLQTLSFGFLPSYVSNGNAVQPVIDWTLAFDGQSFTVTCPIYCYSTDSELGFAFPETFYNGLTPATLTVTEFGSNGQELGSATYDFELTQPVPEPPTGVLVSMGLMITGLAITRELGLHGQGTFRSDNLRP